MNVVNTGARMPTRHAVLIGVNDYHGSLGKLKYCVRDCQRLAEVLTTGSDAIASDDLLLLTDEARGERYPSFGGIISWLGSFLSRPKEDDTILVYFAGHGRTVNGKCYLAPADATLDTLHVTGIGLEFLQDMLQRCKARQKVLVVDACHSGAGRDVVAMERELVQQLAAGKGLYTIASCGADERSHEWEEKQQGVFSYYFAEALGGGCPADFEGHVTMDAVYDYVHDRVRAWAVRDRAMQTPMRYFSGEGRIVIVRRPCEWKTVAERFQNRVLQLEQQLQSLSTNVTRAGYESVRIDGCNDVQNGRLMRGAAGAVAWGRAMLGKLPWPMAVFGISCAIIAVAVRSMASDGLIFGRTLLETPEIFGIIGACGVVWIGILMALAAMPDGIDDSLTHAIMTDRRFAGVGATAVFFYVAICIAAYNSSPSWAFATPLLALLLAVPKRR